MVSSGLEAQQPHLQESTVVIFIGPPGAGKGTQASWLHTLLKLPHISTGDLLRANIQRGSSLGKRARAYIEQGGLVPDDLILDLLFDRVAAADCQKGYILDGFPRTLDQARGYHARSVPSSRLFVFNLSLSDQNIFERLLKRLVCNKCSALFHLEEFPPKAKNRCDHCNGALVQRPDDQEEVIRNRLFVYREQTMPLITYYSNTPNLYTISCAQSVQGIQDQITQCLNKEIAKP